MVHGGTLVSPEERGLVASDQAIQDVAILDLEGGDEERVLRSNGLRKRTGRNRLVGCCRGCRELGHARDVMNEALGQGGTSFDALYVNINGESGYFDRSLHAYGREGDPCYRCGPPKRRVAFMNRSSYF